MAITYRKLFHFLIDKKIKKGELQEMAGITASIMARLAKDETVKSDTIGKICDALNCQPNDIMENIPTATKENPLIVRSASEPMGRDRSHEAAAPPAKPDPAPAADPPKPAPNANAWESPAKKALAPEARARIDKKRILDDGVYRQELVKTYGSHALGPVLDEARQERRQLEAELAAVDRKRVSSDAGYRAELANKYGHGVLAELKDEARRQEAEQGAVGV